jgi:hypothetical protein
MFATVFAAALPLWVPAIPSAVLAPELDCTSLLNPDQRAKRFEINIAFRLASGKEPEAGPDGAQSGIGSPIGTPQEAADKLAWVFGLRGYGYHRDGTKITLLDYQGDPIIGIRVWSQGHKDEKEFVPQLAVRWVPRVPPKYNWAILGPAPRSGPPLARMASSLFAGTVAAVAAPEIDFASLPKDCKEPRVLTLWVYLRMASSGEKAFILFPSHFGGRAPWTAHDARQSSVVVLEDWFELRQEGLRLGVVRYTKKTDTGQVTSDPVVGLAVRSNGPVPALQWTWRPGIRDLFRGK